MRSRESQASGCKGQTVTPLNGRARVSKRVKHILMVIHSIIVHILFAFEILDNPEGDEAALIHCPYLSSLESGGAGTKFPKKCIGYRVIAIT